MPGQRVVGRIRLSRLTDESTSLQRQKEIIESWAKTHENIIVGWAIDADVSGSVNPFETPELGQWLTEERMDEWDILCSWKLDRISRRVIALNQLFGWMQDNDKILVCVNDNIDLSTWVGRLIANVIAGVAEGELEAIRERIKSSRKKLAEVGRWPGGRAPYGHIPTRTDVGYVLTPDPEAVKIIHRIADQLIEGNSVDWIRDELNNDGILPPSDHFRAMRGEPKRGALWRSRSIWVLMENKSLLGYAKRHKETVRDKDGRPVLYGEPLMTKEKFDKVQDALAARKTGPVRTRNTSPLLGVAYCYDCGNQLAHRIMNREYGRGDYRYYHCITKTCKAKVMMDAGTVEKLLEEHFITDLGDEPEIRRIYVRASDHTEELNEAQEAVEEIAAMLATAKSQGVKDRLKEQMDALDTRIAALEQMPVRDGGFKYEPTGRTYGEAWEDAKSPEERRKLFLKYGITMKIKQTDRTRTGPGVWHFDINIPEGLKERMAL